MNNKIVRVRWVDATQIEEDISEARLASQELVESMTVGIVVAENEKKLIIAGTVYQRDAESIYQDSLIIPRRYIVEIKELTEKE